MSSSENASVMRIVGHRVHQNTSTGRFHREPASGVHVNVSRPNPPIVTYEGNRAIFGRGGFVPTDVIRPGRLCTEFHDLRATLGIPLNDGAIKRTGNHSRAIESPVQRPFPTRRMRIKDNLGNLAIHVPNDHALVIARR